MKNLMILLFAVIFWSCGEEKKESQVNLGEYESTDTAEGTTSVSNTEEAAVSEDGGAVSGDADASVVEVSIEGNDQMKFNKEEITVPAGSTVKLTLKHVGQLPETVMGHNVVILKEGTNVAEFAQQATSFPDNDYIPENAENVIAHTEVIGGGESVTIEFEAPAPGTYTFICSFPGHYVMMQGTFIVE